MTSGLPTMKSRFVMMMTAIATAMAVSAQEPGDDSMTYASYDFDAGLPSGLARYDEDGHELHFTMVQNGFDSRDSWIRMREEGSENYFAASASRFKAVDGKTPGPASDWMVLPQVWIRGGNAILRWDGRTVNEQSDNPSTYSIYVSTDGNVPSSFGEPVASFTEEADGKWQARSVDLSQFAGKHVYIAFVNNSLDGEILGIDNISVDGEKGLAEIVVTPGEYALGPDRSFVIGGSLTACSDVPVTSLHVECDVAGKTLSADYDGLSLGYKEKFTFSFPDIIAADFGERVDFTIRATVNSTVFDPIECSTTVLSFLPERKVVIEEATGMWCQYCPKGIVAFDILSEKYPDTFIGIAVHMMSAMDPLALDDYANQTTFPAGAPSGWIDRKWYSKDPMVPTWEDNKRTYTTLMGGFETLFLRRMAEQPLAEVSLTATMTSTGEVDVDAVTRFPIDFDNADMRLAIAVTEDHVWKERYFQNNRFSGGSEILAGYETLPSTIKEDYEFNHVARAIYDDRNGIPGSVPAAIKAGESYSFTRKFPAPGEILNAANVKVIAMVIDNATGEIMNAASVKPALAGVGGISAGSGVRIDEKGNAICISADDAEGSVKASLYDIAGRLVGEISGRGEVSLEVSGLSGIYVLGIETRDGIISRKVVF